MKYCPNCRQNFTDITYKFCPKDSSPLTDIDKQKEKTVGTFKKFKIQSSPRLENNTAEIDEPSLSFNISQNFESARDAGELYEITRGFWKILRHRADRAKYAFAVFRGEIKEVYEISGWEAGGAPLSEFWLKRKRERGENTDPSVNIGRFQFVGEIAPKDVRDKYVGKQLPFTAERFPVRYFDC